MRQLSSLSLDRLFTRPFTLFYAGLSSWCPSTPWALLSSCFVSTGQSNTWAARTGLEFASLPQCLYCAAQSCDHRDAHHPQMPRQRRRNKFLLYCAPLHMLSAFQFSLNHTSEEREKNTKTSHDQILLQCLFQVFDSELGLIESNHLKDLESQEASGPCIWTVASRP